jgi:hypothetical protein
MIILSLVITVEHTRTSKFWLYILMTKNIGHLLIMAGRAKYKGSLDERIVRREEYFIILFTIYWY